MAVNIAQQASQAAATGQQMLQDDQNNANTYKAQYQDYNGQADAARQGVSNYTNYMQNEGSAGNQYHGEMGKQLGELGYNPEQMTTARNNLNSATGALSAYSDFANTAASKFGMNAGGFAAANAGALGSLNNNIASNQTVVNGLSDLYKTAQTGANQFTGQVIQGEQNTLGGLQSVYDEAAKQRDSAASMLQFYSDLASKQGGLNAQQQQYYAAAQQAYAQASAAQAQAALYGKQAAQAQQQIDMTNSYMKSPAYQSYLNPTPANSGATGTPSTPVKNGSGGSNIGQEISHIGHNVTDFLGTIPGKIAGGTIGQVFGGVPGGIIGGSGILSKVGGLF